MVRVEVRTVTVWASQIRARVRIVGEGPPVVFLHGAHGLAWDPFLEVLSRRFTVYAPEHPGTTPGDPDALRTLDDLWDLVLYYYELFDELDLEAPAVVGHSFGGMVAAEAAATNPARVSRLVLLCPVGLWRDDEPVKNWMVMATEALAKAAFYEPDGPIAKMALGLPDEAEARLNAIVQMTWTLGCTGKFVWPIPDKGLKKRLHRIEAPTLIVWGLEDKLAPPVYAREFGQRITDARVAIVPRAGHFPHLEQVGPVGDLVTNFLGSTLTEPGSRR